MRRFTAKPTKVLAISVAATVLAAAVSLGTTTRVAHAASPVEGDYREAMRPFTTALAKWGASLQEAAAASAVKPELACAESMVTLAAIGGWMTDDLEGTARLAPDHLAFVHGMLTESVAKLSAEAGEACGNAEKAAATILSEQDEFEWALYQIAFYARHGGGGN